MSTPADDPSLPLVHEGWRQLQLHRPLAAWACWQRALRDHPDAPAARQAQSVLESAPDLPAAARRRYAFRAPDATRRVRWDEALRGRDLEELDEAARAFAALAEEDPADAAAWFNHALCLAWQGRNAQAVADLDRVVQLDHEPDAGFERAVEAWSLAEILRHGAGAEGLSDDLSYSWILDGCDEAAVAAWAEQLGLRPISVPSELAADPESAGRMRAFEWLDRPMPPAEAADGLTVADLPRVGVLATASSTPPVLRLSSPDAQSLEPIDRRFLPPMGDPERPFERAAGPLPLPFLDAAVWNFRLPPDLDPEVRGRLMRAAVEHYYEHLWIHLPRHGLDGRTPLAAADAARRGDPVARAKLAAVVRVREQLGSRPSTAELYQGYPFDRLRTRLGLEPNDPAAVDPDDASCLGGPELDRLDPRELADDRLADAFSSATGLGDDVLAARFAAELIRRADAAALRRLDPTALAAPLVREMLRLDEPDEALAWIDRIRGLADPDDRATLDTWKAEILARADDPDAALALYQALVEADPNPGPRALDAAETLLDNDCPEHARPLLVLARDHARRAGDEALLARVEALLDADDE